MAIIDNGDIASPIEQIGATRNIERVVEDGIVQFIPSATRVYLAKEEAAEDFMRNPPPPPISNTHFLSVDATNEEGGWVKLVFNYGLDEDEMGGGGGGDNVRRTVNIQESMEEIPIQASPRFFKDGKSLITDMEELDYCRRIIAGETIDERTRQPLRAMVKNELAKKLVDIASTGRTHFSYPKYVVKISYPKSKKGSGSSLGDILPKPAGKDGCVPVDSLGSGIDYRLMSRSIDYDGHKHTCTEEWVSSSPNGWEDDKWLWGENK